MSRCNIYDKYFKHSNLHCKFFGYCCPYLAITSFDVIHSYMKTERQLLKFHYNNVFICYLLHLSVTLLFFFILQVAVWLSLSVNITFILCLFVWQSLYRNVLFSGFPSDNIVYCYKLSIRLSITYLLRISNKIINIRNIYEILQHS